MSNRKVSRDTAGVGGRTRGSWRGFPAGFSQDDDAVGFSPRAIAASRIRCVALGRGCIGELTRRCGFRGAHVCAGSADGGRRSDGRAERALSFQRASLSPTLTASAMLTQSRWCHRSLGAFQKAALVENPLLAVLRICATLGSATARASLGLQQRVHCATGLDLNAVLLDFGCVLFFSFWQGGTGKQAEQNEKQHEAQNERQRLGPALSSSSRVFKRLPGNCPGGFGCPWRRSIGR